MIRSLNTSRSAIARIARQQRALQCRTLITPTAIRQADLIQDLYIKELKSYKPTPISPSDAEAHVQKFSAPKPPSSPEEGNIANDLKAYENQTVEVEGQVATGGGAAVEEDWFEDEPEEEVHAAH